MSNFSPDPNPEPTSPDLASPDPSIPESSPPDAFSPDPHTTAENGKQETAADMDIHQWVESLRRADRSLYNMMALEVWSIAKTMDGLIPGFWNRFMINRQRSLKQFMQKQSEQSNSNSENEGSGSERSEGEQAEGKRPSDKNE